MILVLGFVDRRVVTRWGSRSRGFPRVRPRLFSFHDLYGVLPRETRSFPSIPWEPSFQTHTSGNRFGGDFGRVGPRVLSGRTCRHNVEKERYRSTWGVGRGVRRPRFRTEYIVN